MEHGRFYGSFALPCTIVVCAHLGDLGVCHDFSHIDGVSVLSPIM
jgi:hypothetical protein